MKMIQHINRLTLLALSLAVVQFAIAEGGDKDKDKESKKKTPTIIKLDSVKTCGKVDAEKMASEDTLVFEDWDRPDGGKPTNEGDSWIAHSNGVKGYTNGSNVKKEIHSINDLAGIFKRKESNIEVTLYPNPVVDELKVKAECQPNSIRLIDLSGKQHLAPSVGENIDVRSLPQGVYFIQLVYHDVMVSRKFIKS